MRRALGIAVLGLLPYSAMAEAPDIDPKVVERCLEAPDLDDIVCGNAEMMILMDELRLQRIAAMARHVRLDPSPEGMCLAACVHDSTYDNKMWEDCLLEAKETLTGYVGAMKKYGDGIPLLQEYMPLLEGRIKAIDLHLEKYHIKK